MGAPHDHDPAHTLELSLPAEPSSPQRARAAVADHCDAWGLGGLCDDASLVVSELVSNAVRHAGTTIQLTLRASTVGLRLEVSDQSTRPLRPSKPTDLAEGGRGLLLVNAFATHYGVAGHPNGKTVWADFVSPPVPV